MAGTEHLWTFFLLVHSNNSFISISVTMLWNRWLCVKHCAFKPNAPNQYWNVDYLMYVLSVPLLQIEVVNTFKSGTSFQGALRRQSSTTSQNQDVTNVSSPSHMSLSNALSSPTSTAAVPAGREWLLSVCLSQMPSGKIQKSNPK